MIYKHWGWGGVTLRLDGEEILSKRKATKAEIQKAEKKRQAELAEDQAHIASNIRKERTSNSDVLNRAATPFEVAYIEFMHHCAVADFAELNRPEPPAIFSEKYTNEQMPDLLKTIPQNKFYKELIYKLRHESHQKMQPSRMVRPCRTA